jgi:hypothetical protein
MQKLITTQDEVVFVDLTLVTSLSLTAAQTPVESTESRFASKEVSATVLYTSGGQLHLIKEPSFLKILGLTEATKDISTGVPLGSIDRG